MGRPDLSSRQDIGQGKWLYCREKGFRTYVIGASVKWLSVSASEGDAEGCESCGMMWII